MVQLLRARGPMHPPLGGSSTPSATATALQRRTTLPGSAAASHAVAATARWRPGHDLSIDPGRRLSTGARSSPLTQDARGGGQASVGGLNVFMPMGDAGRMRLNRTTTGTSQLARIWSSRATTASTMCSQWSTMASDLRRVRPAETLRNHRELILNYFHAKKQFSSGVVESLNNKVKVTMRKSYGFRTFWITEIALYHVLGKLLEPELTHRLY